MSIVTSIKKAPAWGPVKTYHLAAANQVVYRKGGNLYGGCGQQYALIKYPIIHSAVCQVYVKKKFLMPQIDAIRLN